MEFHRLGFPLFLLVVYAAAAAARGSRVARNIILLCASYAFYAFADPRFVILLALVTIIAFLAGPGLAPVPAGMPDSGARKVRLFGSVALLLSSLAFFKYWDFLATSLNGLLDLLGKVEMMPVLHLTAVAGVSFYTFQVIGYLVDVYRGEVPPERDFLAFALFAGFFPQILAGPIGRATKLLPQWKAEPAVTDRCISDGLFLVLSGALKKVLIGDFLGSRIVQPAFQFPTGIGWIGVCAATVGFAFQLYGDFAGYSEMAIGSARCFGIRLPQNFDAPYRSRNVSEFWNRWHISLSTWIRDYVFLPIAGRAPSRARTLVSGIVSMTLCGLWHGASFAWIAWGFIHGVALGIHQLFLGALRRRFALKKKLDKSVVFRISATLVTFIFCCIGLLVVRGGDPVLQGMPDASAALQKLQVMFSELFRAPRGDGAFFLYTTSADGAIALRLAVAGIALAVATHAVPGSWKLKMAGGFAAAPRMLQGAMAAAVIVLLYIARPNVSPFIYTNF